MRWMTSLRVFAALLVFAGFVSFSHAQNSEAFRRQGQRLEYDRQKLDRARIDLTLRIDAQKRQVDAYNKKVADLQNIPAGIGRDAAAAGLARERENLEQKRDAINLDINRYKDNLQSYKDNLADYTRRVNAAKAATRFQPGDRVLVEWRGEWWPARVLQAENGTYYVTYDSYGREWDEWVGNTRIGRRR